MRLENEQILTYTKLLTTVCMLLFTIAFLVYVPGVLTKPGYVWGVGIVIATSFFALIVPWRGAPTSIAVIIDLLTIVGVVCAASAVPGVGLSLLLVLPIVSLVWSLRAIGVLLGPAFATATIWLLIGGPPTSSTVTILVVAPLYLVLVAFVTFLLTVKNAAHSRLIQNQARFIAEAALATNQQEMIVRNLLDSVDVCILAVDSHRKKVIENPAMRRLLTAIGINNISGNQLPEIFKEDGVTPFPEENHPAQAFARFEECEGVRLWVRTPDDTMLALDVTIRQLRNSNNEIYLSAVYIRDITAKLLAERARREFVERASTEVAEPLRTLRSAVARYLDAGQVALDRVHYVTAFTEKAGEFLETLETFNTATAGSALDQLVDVRESLLRTYRLRIPAARRRSIEIADELGNPFFVYQSDEIVDRITQHAIDLALEIATPYSVVTITSPGEFGSSSFAIRVSDTEQSEWADGQQIRDTPTLSELKRCVSECGGDLVAEVRGRSAVIGVGFTRTTERA